MLSGVDKTFSPADVARIFEMLFMSAGEGLVVVDHSGSMLMHNPRLHTMFGYDAGDLIGRPIELLMPDAARDRHQHHRDNYNKHPVRRSMGIGLELWGKRKDGTTFPVEVSLNHFEVDGVRYVMGLVTDVTLRRTAEDELHRTNQELERRVEERTLQLQAAERSVREALVKERELHALKSRFVAMASHEFRTPLSTIMSSTDLIARYVDGNERVDKHVTRIRGKVREMTSMLNEFLSLERIEQGLVNCQPTHFDIVHLGIELIEELRTLTGDGQTITYDHEGSDRNVTLDRQMLGNVIVNLMTNAVKYSPQGKPITMRTVIKDGRLRVTVHDQGIGVPEDDHQHLFERFFLGSNVTTIQGTGLGLNLVKRYLDIMQGGIGFSSVPGNTVFTVDLPQHLPVVEGPGHVPAQTTI